MTTPNDNGQQHDAQVARAIPLLPWQLNLQKLHALPSEQQDLFLLTHVAELASQVQLLNVEEISRQQEELKEELLKIIRLKSPCPNRVVRTTLGRCLRLMLEKSASSILIPLIQDLLTIVSAGKEQESKARHAAIHCLGIAFSVAGPRLTSQVNTATTILLKALKPAATDAGLRAAVFAALQNVVQGTHTLDEDLARNIWKQARNGCTDRAYTVQINACGCLEQLNNHTSYFEGPGDIEKLQSTLLKLMESPARAVRQPAAAALGSNMRKTWQSRRARQDVAEQTKIVDAVEDGSTRMPSVPTSSASFSILDVYKQIGSIYVRAGVSNRARSALYLTAIAFTQSIPPAELEKSYEDIAIYFLFDLLNHAYIQANRYRWLITRKLVSIMLNRAIAPSLSESAQLSISRRLLSLLKSDGHKASLCGAVEALAAMIELLGGAVTAIASDCRNALFTLLEHSSFAVQVQACIALRKLMLACPQEIPATIRLCHDKLNTELAALAVASNHARHAIALANALCSLISAAVVNPLYGDADRYADIMRDAALLLKNSSSSQLHISASQVQVAWTLISGLLPLGPNFVKVHLSQLLLIWKNTLPVVARDTVRQRSLLELSYLCHVRECALTALRAFLKFNSRIVTVEVSKRLGLMLDASAAFLQMLPDKKTSDDPATRIWSAFQLADHEIMARRRVYQCFSLLLLTSPAGAPDLSSHSTILATAVASISSTERYMPLSLGTSVASSLNTSNDIWQSEDQFGHGITSLVKSDDFDDPITGEHHPRWSSGTSLSHDIESMADIPVLSAAEYDSTSVYLADVNAYPAATELVNAAIESIALALPLQAPKIQKSIVEQMLASLSSDALVKDNARKSAVTINVALAIWSLTRVASSPVSGMKYSRSDMLAAQPLQDLLRILLVDAEDIVRTMSGSAMGMLCSISSSDFTASQVEWLTNCIVNNRNPEARAGCALSLSYIHARLGGMAAGLHMRHIVGILSSLAADTHPVVHFWALESLTRVAESAGLNYAAYVNSTVGVLSQLYISDSHNEETADVAASNMLVERPVVAAIARGITSLVNVLGPDMQDLPKLRDMITTLIALLSFETSILLEQATLRCQEALSLYMPNHFELQPYVQALQQGLDASEVDIGAIAIDGLRNVMRRDADLVLELALPGLEIRLWDMLNERQHFSAVQNILQTWLQQTALEQTDLWITRLSQILTRTKSQPVEVKPQPQVAIDLQDEDVAGLATNGEPAKDETNIATSTPEFLPWQIRCFALSSLQTLVKLVRDDQEANGETDALLALQHRVGDIIRIAFSASTTGVAELRILGLRLLEQILTMFGRVPDPDFNEAMLLEQYQAQISSALTPAFAADSTPALAAEAINICATFISTGIVTDIERMGRILKVLVNALEGASADVDKTTIGDLQAFGKNAQIMFRISVFSAWAELQVASVQQKYLEAVVAPYVSKMVPLWLDALKEYARLKYEPDISTAESISVDNIYAAFNRQTLLAYYQNAWLSLVNAVASLIELDSQVVFDALDGRVSGTDEQSVSKAVGINYRDEPAAFFFVLFGLTIEAIATYHNETDANKVNLLQALRKILRPSVAGSVIYQDAVFAETIDLMDRMALTDSIAVQTVIVEIATDLCMAHPSSRAEADTDNLSEDIEQLFELTRIIVLVLGDIIPGISETPGSARAKQSGEANALVHTALQALVNVADIFPAIIRTDLRDAILHIFVVMLSTGSCQAVMVPQSLPMFRRLIAGMANQPLPHTERQMANALARMLQIFATAQEQDNAVSLACQKNILLGSALLISAAPAILTHDLWIVQRFLTEIQLSLVRSEVSRVAVGCLRTLLFAGTAPKRLFGMALTTMFEQERELQDTQSLLANLLTAYAGRTSPAKRPELLNIVLSVIVSWAERCGDVVHDEAASRVVELSQLDTNAFRSAFTMFTSEQKKLLQLLLKSKINHTASRTSAEQEPTITLKLDFER